MDDETFDAWVITVAERAPELAAHLQDRAIVDLLYAAFMAGVREGRLQAFEAAFMTAHDGIESDREFPLVAQLLERERASQRETTTVATGRVLQ